MEPILSKHEIADLLSAIKAGKVSTDLVDYDPIRRRRNIPSTEIDLFQTYERAAGTGETRVPNLDIVLDNFSRRFSTSLTNTLQRNFAVDREEISTTNFQQSLLDLKSQGAVGIYALSPLKHGCLVHFDNLMAFALLEIMLGSGQSSESLALNRNLTTIEMAILRTCMSDICQDLQAAMRPVLELQATLTKVENNFRLVNIVEPETEVLVTRFNINLAGENCGQMRVITPYVTLEPLREKFKELVTITQAASNSWTRTLMQEAMEMEAMVTARSGHLTMTIRKILSLKQGDIIDLPYNPDQPLTVLVEDKPIYQAIPGERNSKKAFHITGQYSKSLGGIHGNA
ncbi:FliM/FliN family flagellar motor switch protein [Desulfobulbus rhabdoformis]|uniref:FliM/FliN family flagellar motor switch protein n=1 Tax=Desulfobulbus rhabdoformis TaxID=34032 RepID=UPI00196416D5|nr:FliM/FliN family flagellar motor switch protein [Desulfobulbus rhabdoformis]